MCMKIKFEVSPQVYVLGFFTPICVLRPPVHEGLIERYETACFFLYDHPTFYVFGFFFSNSSSLTGNLCMKKFLLAVSLPVFHYL